MKKVIKHLKKNFNKVRFLSLGLILLVYPLVLEYDPKYIQFWCFAPILFVGLFINIFVKSK